MSESLVSIAWGTRYCSVALSVALRRREYLDDEESIWIIYTLSYDLTGDQSMRLRRFSCDEINWLIISALEEKFFKTREMWVYVLD